MPIVLNGTTGITTPTIAATSASTFTGALALPAGGLNVGSGQLAVDASGRVTMPFQPCFVGNPNATVNSTNKVTSYTNTRTRGGISFSSGTITVPVAGEYAVLVNAITNGTNSLTYSVRKNGAITTYSAIDTGNFRTCALLQVVQMSANDYLELWIENGTIHSDAQYNFVSVFLLG